LQSVGNDMGLWSHVIAIDAEGRRKMVDKREVHWFPEGWGPGVFLMLWAVVLVPGPSSVILAAESEGWTIPAKARKVFEGEYVHRIAGRDSHRAKMTKYICPDETTYFDLVQSDVRYLLAIDGQGCPVAYRYRSAAKGYEGSFQFTEDKVVYTTQNAKQEVKQFDWAVRAGALPDLNSRPDPYLVQYVLLHAYDLDKRGEQTFVVYDFDSTGEGVNHYEITLDLVDEDGVVLSGGRCTARHFLQVQRTASDTWFKKRPGHKTEYWVDANDILLRVYRHREPYEVVLETPTVAEPLAPGVFGPELEAFFDEIDRTYPFFELKGIGTDWQHAKERFRARAKACSSDAQFLGIVRDAVLCLHDSHMWFTETRASVPPLPATYCPGISFLPATDGRVVILSRREGLDPALRTGAVVTKIDDQDARRYLDEEAKKVWAEGGMSGPQRARLMAYRTPLRTQQKGERHWITLLLDQAERRVELACDFDARFDLSSGYNRPEGLKGAGSCAYTQLASRVGYICLRRVDATTAPGLKEAVATHPDARGWIVDLRGNSGGGYDQSLLEALKELPRPLAGIIDAGCISAGETLARDLVQLGDARLFGSRTAGASTAKRDWTFPGGVATLSLPVRSRWGIGGQLIELHGIEPHVEVEAVPEDLLRGLNTEILKAEQYILASPG